MPLACCCCYNVFDQPVRSFDKGRALTEQVAAIISHLENSIVHIVIYIRPILRYASKTTINECWYGMYGTAKLKGGAVRLAEDRYGDDFANERQCVCSAGVNVVHHRDAA